jgi:hypothetical protein
MHALCVRAVETLIRRTGFLRHSRRYWHNLHGRLCGISSDWVSKVAEFLDDLITRNNGWVRESPTSAGRESAGASRGCGGGVSQGKGAGEDRNCTGGASLRPRMSPQADSHLSWPGALTPRSAAQPRESRPVRRRSDHGRRGVSTIGQSPASRSGVRERLRRSCQTAFGEPRARKGDLVT